MWHKQHKTFTLEKSFTSVISYYKFYQITLLYYEIFEIKIQNLGNVLLYIILDTINIKYSKEKGMKKILYVSLNLLPILHIENWAPLMLLLEGKKLHSRNIYFEKKEMRTSLKHDPDIEAIYILLRKCASWEFI